MIWFLKIIILLLVRNPALIHAGYSMHDKYVADRNCATYEAETETINRYNNNTLEVEVHVSSKCGETEEYYAMRAYQSCKKQLLFKLRSVCGMTQYKRIGEINYCFQCQYGLIKCHLVDYACVSNWDYLKKEFTNTAIDFLRNKTAWLDKETLLHGYSSCHPIEGLDASACARDCERFTNATSPFAINCKENFQGTPKCCIRRDKANCHECRYCCIVPFCTYKIYEDKFASDMVDLIEQSSYFKASETLYAQNMFYKDRDTRCLAPDPSKPPSQWGHYDPEEFHNAMGKDVEKLKVIDYDNRFFNFEDPEVFRLMTSGDGEYKHQWNTTYGFDYVKKTKWQDKNLSDILKCSLNCMKEEKQGKFAKDCTSKGGFFKCCVSSWNLTDFENTRKRLYEEGLIGTPPAEICNSDAKYQTCILCTSTYICTTKNEFNQEISFEYKSPTVNPVGGRIIEENHKFSFNKTGLHGKLLRSQFRSSFCARLNFCGIQQEYYNITDFMAVSNREEYCSLISSNIETSDEKGLLKHRYIPEVVETCNKQTSLVRTCPKDNWKTHEIELQNKLLKLQILRLNKTGVKERRRRRKKKKKGRKKVKTKKKARKPKKQRRQKKQHQKNRRRNKSVE